MNEELLLATGARQSPPDYRDIALTTISEPREYPSKWILDISALDIWNQRKIGACVGHAGAKYKQYLDYVDTGHVKNLSPRFLYALAKCLDGYRGEGTYPRLVAKILKDTGCATEDTCPNDTTLSHDDYVYDYNPMAIPQNAYDDAKMAKTSGYAFCDMSKASFKQAIHDLGGFMLLMRLGNEWWTDKDGNHTYDPAKLFPLRKPTNVISGHQVYVYGYEDVGDDTIFYFANSWTKDWGKDGCGWFSYKTSKDYLVEAITFVDIPDNILMEHKSLPAEFKHNFETDLAYGDEIDEVVWLQRALKVYGTFNHPATGFYWDITAKAVLDFQIKENIGLTWYERYVMKGRRVGPKTRAALNRLYNK